MRLFTRAVVCSLILVFSSNLYAQEPSKAPAAMAQASFPSHPDSPNGLRDLLNSLAAAIQKNDDAESARIIRSMILDDPGWFTGVFGTDLGGKMASHYEKRSQQISNILTSSVRSNFQPPSDELLIARVERDDQPKSQNIQAVLMAMKNPAPLYCVQFVKKANDKSSDLLGAFIYDHRGFRYLPENVLLDIPGTQSPPQGRVRVGGDVQAAARVRLVQPKYPKSAKKNHIEGTVVLHAIISKDGAIQQLEAVSGPSELIPSALEAVKQWVYRPTFIKGEPVQVDTTISVVFVLDRP